MERQDAARRGARKGSLEMVTVGELAVLRELQGRALEAVARRWAHDPGPAAVATSDPTPAAGLTVLAAALGAETAPADPASRSVLRQVVEVTGRLAEAARQVATAAGPVGWSRAAEVADAISTTAQALRMLAEIELAAIPGP